MQNLLKPSILSLSYPVWLTVQKAASVRELKAMTTRRTCPIPVVSKEPSNVGLTRLDPVPWKSLEGN